MGIVGPYSVAADEKVEVVGRMTIGLADTGHHIAAGLAAGLVRGILLLQVRGWRLLIV